MALFTQICCGECGIEFQVPEHFHRECKERGKEKGWYCPNGHRRVYGESNSDVLRRERDLLKQQLAQKDDEVTEAKRRRDAAEKQTARITKRVNAGMCTCCRRTFPNLAQHMATKHGDAASAAKVVQLHRKKVNANG